MSSHISKNYEFEKYTSYSILAITLLSFIIGFILRENSAGGGLIDLKHEWHNYNLLKNDSLAFLFGNYEASRFPLFHFLNIKLNPFINSQNDFLFSFFIYSFTLIFIYYYCLSIVFKNSKKYLLFILLSILLLSPYFRTSSFWGLQENLAYIFFLACFALYKSNPKKKLTILLLSFLSFYSDQKFILIPLIFFFKYLDKNQIFSRKNINLAIYCNILFLPALVIFYIWGGITKSETTSGINEFSFRPQNLLFSLNIISLYLMPFIFLKLKNYNFFKFINLKNLIYIFLFIILYLFIRYFYLDTNLPISGGWSFKIFKNLYAFNNIFAEIFFLLVCLLSFVIIFAYFDIFKNSFLNKMILFFLIFYPLTMEIVFQEYFDPLMLFIAIFFIHKEDVIRFNFQKTFFIYIYFLTFWISTISYYYIFI